MSPTLVQLLAASGADATSNADAVPASNVEYRFDPERTVGLLARSLAVLHSIVPPTEEQALSTSAVLADRTADPIRADQLDEGYAHMSPDRLLEILADSEPSADGPLVVTHGDPTLDTLRCVDGKAVGFVDWEGAGVADPHRDLAAAAASIAANLGPMLVPVFFETYGRRPDPSRLEWWSLALQLRPRP